MPQPLAKVKRVHSIAWGAGAFTERPELAMLVMEIVALWAETELKLGWLLGKVLGAEREAGMAIYLSLTGADARRAALEAAANLGLKDRPEDLSLYNQVMVAIKPVRDRRNEFVHGVWAFSPELPDALLWNRAENQLLNFLDPNVGASADTNWHSASIMVYRKKDLERDLADARDATNAVFYLRLVIQDHGKREQIRQNLFALPLLARRGESRPR